MKAHNNANDPTDDSLDDSSVFKIYKTPASTQYDIILSKSVVGDLTNYFELLQFLDNEVRVDDVVNVKLANYGGDLHSGVALAHSIKNCKATVVCHVISSCYSMAALLALCGDALLIYPGNYLMFHNYSGGEIGKAGEIETSHVANKKSWAYYLKYFCGPFLTEDEINSILTDRDLYVHHDAKGLKKRMKGHFPQMVMK
jgi:ATP-dependent protease ClpP protease subunit